MKHELGFIAVVAFLIAGAFFIGFLVDRAACNAKSVSFEDRDFGIIQGCMVKHNGRWLPLDNIRGFDDKG